MAASFEILRSLLFSSITNVGYTAIGTPLTNGSHAFRLTNATDGDMFFSIDGVNPYFFLPAGTSLVYDVQTNTQRTNPFLLPQGTQFSVKYSSAPTKNDVYIETMYSNVPGF